MKHRSSVLCAMCERSRQNSVLGCGDAGNPDRSSVNPEYRPLEGMLGYFARLQLDESICEIVSPTTKGLIRLTLFCRPLHRRPNKCGCKSGGSRQVGYDILKAERIKSRGALGSAREARPALWVENWAGTKRDVL